jgi:hypothetical protein
VGTEGGRQEMGGSGGGRDGAADREGYWEERD